MLLFQRLIHDPKCGYNYDYMGRAEYEFGATKITRSTIAKAWLDGAISARKIKFGRTANELIDVVAVGNQIDVDKLPDELWGQNHGFLGTEMEKIVGWMGVADSPNVLLLRKIDSERLENFLKPAVDQIQANLQNGQ